MLPDHVKKAIQNGKMKQKHSEFYSKLRDLNIKINVYKQIFETRVPYFQKSYMKRRLEYKHRQQLRERFAFEKDIEEAQQLQRKKLAKLQSQLNVASLKLQNKLSVTQQSKGNNQEWLVSQGDKSGSTKPNKRVQNIDLNEVNNQVKRI